MISNGELIAMFSESKSHLAPLKVVRNVCSAACNIGTEGSLDAYLCDDMSTPTPHEQVILVIFVARNEDYSMKVTKRCPIDKDETLDILADTMEILKTLYMKHSMKQRLECQQVH